MVDIIPIELYFLGMAKNEALQKAVDLAGGQVAMVNKIKLYRPESKISQGLVWAWLNTVKAPTPPAEYVLVISAAVNEMVTPHELRPDIYPNPMDGMRWRKKNKQRS